jgi:hypothetical protein
MANPLTIYVAEDDDLIRMRAGMSEAADLLGFKNRNQFLLWLMLQPADEIAKALKPLKAKDLQRQANSYR